MDPEDVKNPPVVDHCRKYAFTKTNISGFSFQLLYNVKLRDMR